MKRFDLRYEALIGMLATGVLLGLGATGCWELEEETAVEGNYTLTYDDVIRVYVNDSLVVELDGANGGTIPLTDEIEIEYDELCSGEDAICPSEAYWDEVAIYQPLGVDNALLNAVNIGSIGEEGVRLAGLLGNDATFDLLLGLSASANEQCLAIGISLAEGQFVKSAGANRNAFYDGVEDGTISLTYGAGCEITPGVTLSAGLRFETDFYGDRTGDLDVGDVEVDPAIDENGDPIDEDPLVD
ncbi:MAG: hypothetical protein CMJ87_13290 [Planctomycetes bacterium]|nr:hypothetical protein [Planctomycetota bacterium]